MPRWKIREELAAAGIAYQFGKTPHARDIDTNWAELGATPWAHARHRWNRQQLERRLLSRSCPVTLDVNPQRSAQLVGSSVHRASTRQQPCVSGGTSPDP